MTTVVDTLPPITVAVEVQPEANAIANAPTSAVSAGEFVFFAAFDGTDNGPNPPADGSGDSQTTAVFQLTQQVSGPNIIANYYPGPGANNTLPGSDGLIPSNVLKQAIIAAQTAYKNFATEATAWRVKNPDGPLTSMIVSFSRGGASAAIFAQMLYENGLVNASGEMLIPPGQIGSVSAALIIDPVLTEDTNVIPLSTSVVNNMDFPNTVKNLTVVAAQNEVRSLFDLADYNDPNATYYPVLGAHGDAGDVYSDANSTYGNALGGIYLQAYTQFFAKAGLPIGPVPAYRAYIPGTAADVHTEAGNPPLYDNILNPPGPRVTTPAGTPVTVVDGTATTFTTYDDDIVIGGTGFSATINSKTIVLLPKSSASINGAVDIIRVDETATLELTGSTLGDGINLTKESTVILDDPRYFNGDIFNFVPTDTIDLAAFATITSASLSASNVLAVQGSVGALTVPLDPSQNYTGDSFVFSSDGKGGTDVTVVLDSHDVTFPGGNALLLVNAPTQLTGTISGFAAGDTIDLAGIGTTTSAALGANNVLTVQGSGGDASLQLDPSQNYAGDSFVFGSDGNGGTNVAVESDSQNVKLPSGPALLLVTDPANFTGTISGFAAGDTIDLAGIGTATSATLATLVDNVLTVDEASGNTLGINLPTSDNYGSEALAAIPSPDGNGGTNISLSSLIYSVNTIQLNSLPSAIENTYEGGVSFVGINDSGDLLYNTRYGAGGYYKDPSNYSIGVGSGYESYVKGINDGGVIVGTDNINVYDTSYTSYNYGFIYDNGQYTVLSDPNSYNGIYAFGGFSDEGTYATGINNNGEVVGYYVDQNYKYHGFIYNNGQYKTVDNATYGNGLLGINDSGDLIGYDINYYNEYEYRNKYFEVIDGKYSSLNFAPSGINDSNIIVGNVLGGNGGPSVGVIDVNGTEYIYKVPNAVITTLEGINDENQIVGEYETSAGWTAFVTTILTIESSAACYCRGTLILTDRGEIPVERLAIGDIVVTASGRLRPIKWIGYRALNCSRHPHPKEVWPIRVSAGAFGENKPSRDLWLSPGHNIAAEGALMPISALQNGKTVVQQERSTVEYWHIELDEHDIIIADGLPAESYLDTGNRTAFVNGGAFIEAHPDFKPRHWAETCLPLVSEGPEVTRTKALLLERLKAAGHEITSHPDLHIIADGKRIEPTERSATRIAFNLPRGRSDIRLVSRSFIPAHTLAESTDTRSLGICVKRLRIDGEDVALDDETLLSTDWYDVEPGLRWTRGSITLPPKTRLVVIELAGPGHYWEEPSDTREALYA